MNQKKNMRRHGDVGILKCKPPSRDGREKLEHLTLAEGEVTGHSHRVLGDAVLYNHKDGNTYLNVRKTGAKVVHQEHKPINLPKGTYRIIQQREWSPEGNRNVVD